MAAPAVAVPNPDVVQPNSFRAAANAVHNGARRTTDITGKVLSDTGTLQKILKIVLIIVRGVTDATPLHSSLDNTIEVIDAAQTISDSVELAQMEYSAANAVPIARQSFFVASGITGLICFLDDSKVLEWGKIAASVGKGVLVKTATALAGIGYGLMFVEGIMDLRKANTDLGKASAILKMVRAVVEIAAKVFSLYGLQIMVALGTAAVAPQLLIAIPIVLAVVAASIGIASYVMGLYDKGELRW